MQQTAPESRDFLGASGHPGYYFVTFNPVRTKMAEHHPPTHESAKVSYIDGSLQNRP